MMIMVSLIAFVVGFTAAASFADWWDKRLKQQLLQRAFEVVEGDEGIIAISPLDPRRHNLITLQKRGDSEHLETVASGVYYEWF